MSFHGISSNISKTPKIGVEAIIIGARCNIFQCCDITIYIVLNLADETAYVHIGNVRNLAEQAKDKLEIHSRR